MKNLLTILLILLLGQIQFSSCTSPSHHSSQVTERLPDSVYMAQGKTIVGAVFSKLSGELSVAMQSGGVEEAVPYCNARAYPLTDSLAEVYKVFIKRTSLKVRNPQNVADSMENEIINTYLQKKTQGEPLTPMVVAVSESETRFFAPIILAAPCLKCHGDIEKDISLEKYAFIKDLYRSDEATGYAEGDLRGIWSVAFR
ncbi:MAG: DUF3365 domain-containing protein [Bacteroidia bacterium]